MTSLIKECNIRLRRNHNAKARALTIAASDKKLTTSLSQRVATRGVLQTAEGVLVQMPAAVSALAVAARAFAVSFSGNDGNSSGVTSRTAQPVGIEASVGEQVTHATGRFEKRRRGLYVANNAGREYQDIGLPMTLVSAQSLVVHPSRAGLAPAQMRLDRRSHVI